MNYIYKLLLGLSFIATVLCGCDDNGDVNSSQEESIVSYLTSTHSPRLVTEAEALSSLVPETPFYRKTGSTTYMYIDDYYNPGRETQPEITDGCTVELIFTLYDFTNASTPTLSTLLYTNDSDMKSSLNEEGFDTLYWNFDPIEIIVGKGDLFSSVEKLMIGCREGDNLEFYLTTNESYGDVIIGVAAEDTAVALYCEILKVVNN